MVDCEDVVDVCGVSLASRAVDLAEVPVSFEDDEPDLFPSTGVGGISHRLPTLCSVLLEPHVGVAVDGVVGHTVRAVHRRIGSRRLYRTRVVRERS